MTDTGDDFNDIATAIMRLQRAFRRRRMEPAIIELSSWEDGQNLAWICQRYLHEVGPASVVMPTDTGVPSNQIEIAGTIVRWPTERMALRNGGMKFI